MVGIEVTSICYVVSFERNKYYIYPKYIESTSAYEAESKIIEDP